MLVTSIKTLCDLAVALVTEHRRSDAVAFEHHYKPCYEAAKTVFDDYAKLFGNMRKRIEGGAPIQELLTFIQESRSATLALRHELRAALASIPRDPDSNPPDFETAILGILSGAYSTAHALGHFRDSIALQLGCDEESRRRGEPLDDPAPFRASLLAQLDTQLAYIEACFTQAATQYAAARAALLPKSKRTAKRNERST